MFKNRDKCAFLLCILVLLAGCSRTVENSSKSVAGTTSVIGDTTPSQGTVTAGTPNGDKLLFKERFAEARKVALHYTTAVIREGDGAKLSYGGEEHYRCEHYSAKAELSTATAAVFTNSVMNGFYKLLDSYAYLDRDDGLYIAPSLILDASPWQAEDTISFQGKTVNTFLWDSLTVTEAGDHSISYTMQWYHTYPGDPITALFTLVKGGDGIWRFDKCFRNEATPLTAEKVQQYNKAFELPTNREGKLSFNPLNLFLTSSYDRPENINLVKFVWYFPPETEVTDEAEFEALKADEKWVFNDDDTLDNMIVPVHRISAAAVNKTLKKYAGITLDKLSGVGTEKRIYLYF